MKAILIRAPGHAGVVDAPEPSPAPGEVVVEVMAVTTCPQWDMHLWDGRPMFAGAEIPYPYAAGQPGHEMSGVVVELGEGVAALREGQKVAAWRDPGHDRPGCYAQRVAMRAEDLIAIPDDADFVDYAPFELAMCVAVSFMDLLKVAPIRGKTVGVSGLGPAGLIAAQYAKAEGASRVVGFELSEARARAAAAFGVDEVVDPREDATRGRRLDVSVDCVGARASAEYLLKVTREAVSIFGVQREPFTYPADAGPLKLLGYTGHSRAAAGFAMERVRSGRVRLGPLVTERMPLEHYARAVAMLKEQRAVKVCFLPNG